MSKKIDLNADEMVALYLDGLSTNSLAERYGCSRVTISTRLKQQNVIIRQRSKSINENEMVGLYLEGMSVVELAKCYGCSWTTISTRLKQQNVIIRQQFKDITGLIFGHLLVESTTNELTYNGTKIWQCRCLLCNKTCLGNTARLLSGKKRSCGCLQKRVGDKHPGWKGCGELSGEFWAGLKHNAKNRSSRTLEFNIEIADMWQLFVAQNRKCSLSGIELNFIEPTASLDRIDSGIGYVKENVQWVHKDVNLMKQSLSQNHFIDLCSMIARNKCAQFLG